MIAAVQTDSPKIVGFRFSGKLHDEDYKSFVPAIDAVVASEGRVRLLLQFGGLSRMGPARRVGRFQVRPEALLGL